MTIRKCMPIHKFRSYKDFKTRIILDKGMYVRHGISIIIRCLSDAEMKKDKFLHKGKRTARRQGK